MSKKVFKVGDSIRIISNWETCSCYKGFIRRNAPKYIDKFENGYAPNVGDIGKVVGIGEHSLYSKPNQYLAVLSNGRVFCIGERGVELNQSQSIYISADNNKTIAVMKEGKQEVGRGVATCNPSNEFDFKTGAKLAMERLLGEEVKEASNDVREVSRKANVGEWIKFKSDAGNGKLLNKIGKVLEIGKYTFRVEHEKAWAQSCESRKGFEITNFSSNPLYVVLENYNPEKTESAEPTQSKDEHLSFKKVKRRAEVGEYVYVVNADVDDGCYKDGEIYEVKRFLSDCVVITTEKTHKALGLEEHESPLWEREYVVLEGYQPPKTFDRPTENTFSKEQVLKAVEQALGN